MSKPLLGRRYSYGGRPFYNLDQKQKIEVKRINENIKSNKYQFEKIECPICTSNDFELISTKDRYGLYVPVNICRNCGLVQTNPRMSQAAYNDFYSYHYRDLYIGTKKISTQTFFDNQISQGKNIINFLNDNTDIEYSNLKVLEVGCGAGGILYQFKEMGAKVKGIDLGVDYLNFGKENYSLDLTIGSSKELQMSEKFDLIIYSHCFEHILDLEEELEQITRLLTLKGIIYIEVPGIKYLKDSNNNDLLSYLQNAHTFHFSLRSLTNILEKNDFQLLHGDEFVRSIFKKSDHKKQFQLQNDYLEVKNYILETEKLRRKYQIMPKDIRDNFTVKKYISYILKQIGIFKPLKKIYTIFKG